MRTIEKITKNGIRHAVQRVYYKLTAANRVLPDFLILGAQKAGTTSLYHYLVQHPQVLPSFKKEVRFFDKHYHKGVAWYRAYFPMHSEIARAQHHLGLPIITGESSPPYLHHPVAAKRISHVVPEAKLIILLRDPVARAYSHYHHNVRKGRETLSFEEAVTQEERRLTGERERIAREPEYKGRNFMHFAYLDRGLYGDQIREYLEYFHFDNLYIISSEEFFGDVQSATNGVCSFLGIEPYELANSKARNVGSYDKSRIPCEDDLRNYFNDHNEALFRLIDRRFDW